MKTWTRTIGTAALVAVLSVPAVEGQKSRSITPAPRYNPTAEIRVRGTIQEVTYFMCPVSGGSGAHLRLDASQQTVEVHLAPSWFVERYRMKFRLGAKVEVVGVRYSRRGETGLMARQVESSEGVYSFRDPDGNPLWLP
jgi:hypothetical protein